MTCPGGAGSVESRRLTLQQVIPINADARNGGYGRLTPWLEHYRWPVPAGCDSIDRDGTIGRIYQPDLWNPGTFEYTQFSGSVVGGGRGREDFRDPVGCASHAAVVELMQPADDNDIGLYHSVELIGCIAWFSEVYLAYAANDVHAARCAIPDRRSIRIVSTFCPVADGKLLSAVCFLGNYS